MNTKDVAFVELWKPEIINLLVKLDGMSYSEAYNRWFYAYREFDKKVFKIIEYILKHEKMGSNIMLNRNPTINAGSYLAMSVASAKKDYDDLSCSLPIQCLKSLNADFDGDTLNITKEITTEFKKAFRNIFYPRTGFMIDHNDGLLNTNFYLIKDEVITLYNWCTI